MAPQRPLGQGGNRLTEPLQVHASLPLAHLAPVQEERPALRVTAPPLERAGVRTGVARRGTRGYPPRLAIAALDREVILRVAGYLRLLLRATMWCVHFQFLLTACFEFWCDSLSPDSHQVSGLPNSSLHSLTLPPSFHASFAFPLAAILRFSLRDLICSLVRKSDIA